MKKKYSKDEIREGFRKLAILKKENMKLKLALNKLQNEVVIYRACEVADFMRTIGFNDREAHAAISMLRRSINR